MTEELKELNESYYELVGKLHENKEMLSEEMFQYMQSVILEQYRLDYRLLMAEGKIDPERKIFAADLLYDHLVPQRRKSIFFWRRKWNFAAQQLMRETADEACRFFESHEPPPPYEGWIATVNPTDPPDKGSTEAVNPTDPAGKDQTGTVQPEKPGAAAGHAT